MSWRPYQVARYGVYAALAIAALSVWLGLRAGGTLDYLLMRGTFVFVVITALAFAAEAMLSFGALRPLPPPKESERDENSDE